ncbi:MAG: Sec1 family protein [archaeon]|nr:Sec1 family protein [archaeon]
MDTFQEAAEPKNIFEPIDLTLFKDHIQQSLLTIIDTMPKKPKTLIIEDSCITKLSYFSELEPLEKKGVNRGIQRLTENPIPIDTDILIFVISSSKVSLEWIENQIKSEQGSYQYNATSNPEKNIIAQNKQYHIIFFTKINNECFNFINQSSYKSFFITHNLNAEVYPLDYDILSIEQGEALKELYINNNFNCLSMLARTIVKFETVFGKIKNKYSKGNFSKILFNLLEGQEENSLFDNENEILACVMMDRGVDFLTMFCSDFVYEGLLNDYFGINLNSIKVSTDILSKEDKADSIKIDLSSKDKFYHMIKNYAFSKLSTFLPIRLKQHNLIMEQGKKSNELTEVSQTLKKIKVIKEERTSLIRHINLADHISKTMRLPKTKQRLQMEQILLAGEQPPKFMEFLEDEVNRKAPLTKVLKILCIDSLVEGGIKPKNLEPIKRDILFTYGYDKLFLLKNLEKMDILKNQSKSYYNYLKEKLRLISERVNLDNPDDACYAYVGYCPLTIRLIEALIREGWQHNSELLKLIPGELKMKSVEKDVINVRDRSFVLLVFVGGITYGELAAIRYLNSKIRTHKFIVLTTSIINGENILNQLCFDKNDSFTHEMFYEDYKNYAAKRK